MRRMGEGLGSIPAPLGRAERAMRGAREALQQGRGYGAMQNQTRSLEQMADRHLKMLRAIQLSGRTSSSVASRMSIASSLCPSRTRSAAILVRASMPR